jgi:hypothetical protein
MDPTIFIEGHDSQVSRERGRGCPGLLDLNVTNKQTRTNKQPSLTDRFELIITCNVIMPMNQSH